MIDLALSLTSPRRVPAASLSPIDPTPAEPPTFRIGTGYFVDTANVPAGTTCFEYEARLVPGVTVATSNQQVFGQSSAGGLRAVSGGTFAVLAIEDVSTVQVFSGTGRHTLVPGERTTLALSVDFATGTVTLTRDGTLVESGTMSISGSTAQTGRRLFFFTYVGNSPAMPGDWDVEYVKLWLTTAGTRSLRKEISLATHGTLAAINADPWTKGAFTDST